MPQYEGGARVQQYKLCASRPMRPVQPVQIAATSAIGTGVGKVSGQNPLPLAARFAPAITGGGAAGAAAVSIRNATLNTTQHPIGALHADVLRAFESVSVDALDHCLDLLQGA